VPHRDIDILILAKAPRRAFSRLSSALDTRARAALSDACLQITLDAAKNASVARSIHLLVSEDAPDDYLRCQGCDHVWRDDPNLGLADNVRRVARRLAEERTGGLLIAPIDLPYICASNLSDVVTAYRTDITIGQSARDGGSTVLLTRRPDVMHFFYEAPESAAAHFRFAQSKKISAQLINDHPLCFDIDVAGDLERLNLAQCAPETRDLWRGVRSLISEERDPDCAPVIMRGHGAQRTRDAERLQ